MRRRSFADWTHEITTPLSSVLGYLESLQMPGFDEATRARYVDTAYERALALRALTDDLATLSQLDFDGLRLDRVPVDVPLLVELETRALAPSAGAAGVELAVGAIAPGLALLGDRQRLGQVLRNVLTNAIRHTRPGARVELRALAQGDRVAIEIEDHGSGIAAAHLAHLGERFYRPDGSRDRRTGGRGLGLAIARGIVEAHGGTLAIHSQLGVGTRVTIAIPSGALF
jgi:two-component system sensor histidine kinase BaeS